MIDYSLIKLIPADESYHEFSYQVKKAAEGAYITEIWGWDEDIQRDFHAREWQENRPQIIMYDSKPIGTIFIGQSKDCIEIKHFFILPEYQNMGIGSYLLKRIQDHADKSGRIVRLKYMRNNPVGSLYKRHGFQVVGFDQTYYSMERKLGVVPMYREFKRDVIPLL
jgi:GNAT superfamily N-acetyltransferase